METYCDLLRLAGSVRGGVIVLLICGAAFAGLVWYSGNPLVAGGVAALFLLLTLIALLGC